MRRNNIFDFGQQTSLFYPPLQNYLYLRSKYRHQAMRKFYIITLLALLGTTLSASAQRVALEERIPKIKTDLWLDGKSPEKAQYTYIEFVYSKTAPCIQTFLKIQEEQSHFGENLRAVIITKENPEQISDELRKCVTDYVNVAFDPEGEIFRTFGVHYVPFGIIIDHRRKAVWFGNPITLIEEISNKTKYKKQ